MTIAVYLLLALFLLALNAFFVLAEFASVKMRPSRTEELIAQGVPRANVVKHVQARLDEYLSVCQVGITFASIGLGFVGEPAFAELIKWALGVGTATAHTVAVTAGYVLVSSLHIVFGELLPKSLALRKAEGSALLTAVPLRFFHAVFYVPLTILNGATVGILRCFGLSRKVEEVEHSEEELRIILAHTQEAGVFSFERLLLLENIFDLRGVTVRTLMRPRAAAKVLRAGAPWAEQFAVVRDSRFSRYPLVEEGRDLPLGIVHVKDVLYEDPGPVPTLDLRKLARPYLEVSGDLPVEKLLASLRRHRGHFVLVKDEGGPWTGFLTLEDVLEEIVGSIEDEFEVEPPVSLADALSPGRVVLGLEASSLEEAVGKALGRVPAGELPLPVGRIAQAVLERERAMSTYLGSGLAVPHARIEGLARPLVLFARAEAGIPIGARGERARLVFILLSPAGAPRDQVRLLARIAALVQSEYVAERLLRAEDPAAIVEAVRAAESIAV